MIDTEVSPNVVSFSSLLHACAKASDRERAEKWMNVMMTEGPEEPNAICFNAVIHACAREINVERANFWIEKMMSSGVKPTVNSFSTIIDTLAKQGDLDAAISWLKLMRDCG